MYKSSFFSNTRYDNELHTEDSVTTETAFYAQLKQLKRLIGSAIFATVKPENEKLAKKHSVFGYWGNVAAMPRLEASLWNPLRRFTAKKFRNIDDTHQFKFKLLLLAVMMKSFIKALHDNNPDAPNEINLAYLLTEAIKKHAKPFHRMLENVEQIVDATAFEEFQKYFNSRPFFESDPGDTDLALKKVEEAYLAQHPEAKFDVTVRCTDELLCVSANRRIVRDAAILQQRN